jgi:hypothetical protein
MALIDQINGNLDYAQSGNASHGFGTMAVPSTSSTGYYFEAVCTTMDTARTYIGLIDPLALPAVIGFTDFACLLVTLADFINNHFYTCHPFS